MHSGSFMSWSCKNSNIRYVGKSMIHVRIKLLVSLKFIRLLRVVFSSQQRLNRPAVNAVQWRHSLPENRVVILIGWLSKHSHNYVWLWKNLARLSLDDSAHRIPGILSFSSNISISLIFILNSKYLLFSKLKC